MIFLILIQILSNATIQFKTKAENSFKYLNKESMAWVSNSTQSGSLPLNTDVFVNSEDSIMFIIGNDQIYITSHCYFNSSDLLVNSESRFLSAWTSLFLATYKRENIEKRQHRDYSVTYGNSPEENQIPFYSERKQAIATFLDQKLIYQAIFSQKKLMADHRELYRNPKEVEFLFTLYRHVGLNNTLVYEIQVLRNNGYRELFAILDRFETH